ncbi:hypothetical protein [Microbulbifer epialgicus]|uniref:Uncharacterized protein n=1 Tax=Microbulbifer epialgicus TaxID=393907 RepID=A0ABV4P0T4_9GAMM
MAVFWGLGSELMSTLKCIQYGFNSLLASFLCPAYFQYRLGKKKYSFPIRLHCFFPLGLVAAFLSGIIGAIGSIKNPFFLNYVIDKENLITTKALNTLVLPGTKIAELLSILVFNKSDQAALRSVVGTSYPSLNFTSVMTVAR